MFAIRVLLSVVSLSVACNKGAPESNVPVPNVALDAAAPSRAIGDWRGALSLPGGATLTIVVHVTGGEQGLLAATMDSPDQGGFGIPITSVTASGDSFVLDVSGIGGHYTGVFSADDHIEGSWSQGGSTMPLSLQRVHDVVPLSRPQEPKPPFPYLVTEVTLPSVDGVTLAGTLTVPEGAGPFPAVVLVTGSGPQDRDESLMGHKPFAVLADHLSRKGIAVLRTDDRGTGKSTGVFQTATTPDFVKDAAAAITWLEARSDTASVGCVGHSEGGIVCPLVQGALPQEGRADFLVLIAGPAVSGAEILVEQSALISMAGGMTAQDAESDRVHSREMFALLEETVGAPDREARLLAKVKASPSAAGASDEVLRASIQQLLTPWFQWFLTYDPVPTLRTLDVPVLALFGEHDLQVPAAQNAAPMREALGSHGTVEVLLGLNHLMQPAKTGAPDEYAKIETTIDPSALERVSSFILATTSK